MRLLITGIAGFAGRHLASLLLARGHEVHGTAHHAGSLTRLADLVAREHALEARLEVVDVTDAGAVAAVVARVQPDGIFHLAGVTFVPATIAEPLAALRVNVFGAVHVFDAVRRHAPSCRVLAVSSGDAYGDIAPEELPVRETCPFRPLSPYGASKAALDVVADQWARGMGLDIVRARPFNHTGPGQRREFVCPNFARQLVAIARGQQPPVVSVGDLDVVRDFSDVRDVVAAYLAAWQHGARGEVYNICSGVGRTVRSVLETLSDIVGVEVRPIVAAERRRHAEVRTVIGIAEKLRAVSGWAPRHDWRDTLETVVADWRSRADDDLER
jgi:GDP-4-dehydro-6-deoxy-D-mannose reductase